MLERSYRLKKNKDFRRLYEQGKSVPSKYVVLYFRRNNGNKTRIGFSVSKRIGSAVERNRVKRILREIMRGHITEVISGVDIILIARVAIKGIKSKDVESNLVRLLNKNNLIKR